MQNQELVTLPGDTPAIAQDQATAAADEWAEHYAGTTSFNSVTLAHLQNLGSNGSAQGAAGPLQWVFAISGPKSFSSALGGHVPRIAIQPGGSPTAYPYSAHYVLIFIDATTGEQDGMVLT